MEVKKKYVNRAICFEDLKPGEVFVYDDDVYLRLYVTYYVDKDEDSFYNAVNLGNGELVGIYGNDPVIRPSKVFAMEVLY